MYEDLQQQKNLWKPTWFMFLKMYRNDQISAKLFENVVAIT